MSKKKCKHVWIDEFNSLGLIIGKRCKICGWVTYK